MSRSFVRKVDSKVIFARKWRRLVLVGLIVCFCFAGFLVATAKANADTGAPPEMPTYDVDVVVFGSQTSGIAAVREITLADPSLRIAFVSCGNLLETPLAQGLSVEDTRDGGNVSGGMYKEWRDGVEKYYRQRGLSAFNSKGRLTYEPEVAASVLWSFVKGPSAPNIRFFSASLVAADDSGGQRYVELAVENVGIVRVNTSYFIDASVEGDLARMLGASYRIGRDETVYNDSAGVTPEYPGPQNDYVTAPQRFSPLLVLKVYARGSAPRVATLANPAYDPGSYASLGPFSQKTLTGFKASWTMTVAVLPSAKRELNEAWNDWPDVGLAFDWIFHPEDRAKIRARVLQWSINRVRYLQEHGYPRVGIATVPQKLYIREGPRIEGLDTYDSTDLVSQTVRECVAIGCYVEYDRHDDFLPNQIDTTRYAYVPMGALLAKDHPWLVVSTAISTDFQAYSSAVRMEHTRANIGGAAGALIVQAAHLGVAPAAVPYGNVRQELLSRGYKVDPVS